MPDELLTGDTQAAPDAGEQAGTEPAVQDEVGETEPADAGQVDGQEGAEEPQLTPEQELAFKRRLERERERLEEKLRAEYEQHYAQPYTAPQETLAVPQDAIETLADRLGITVEAARLLFLQQMTLNEMKDSVAKAEAKAEVQALRAQKPWLPDWDDAKLQKIREDYHRQYGMTLPWREAYQRLVAEAALSGAIVTAAEQQAIKNIAQRNSATVQHGKGQKAKKPDIWSLPKDEFEELVAKAKAGELKSTPL